MLMKLVIGLGNPGEKYTDTRHNIGFYFADKLREVLGLPEFEMNAKFNAVISKSKHIIIAKPQTFMNLSGDSVRALLDFFKLTTDDLVVIHDDLDIPAGEYRIAADSRSAGHNGVQDIIEKLGTQKFKRVRVGIKPEEPLLIDTADFVLQKLMEKERKKIAEAESVILDEIKKFSHI